MHLIFYGKILNRNIYYNKIGRVTGISGIVFGVISFNKQNFIWKSSFILGMLFSTSYLILEFGLKKKISGVSLFDSYLLMTGGLSLTGFIIAGFLVGFGTKLANGCTSGHGLCGLARFSQRSICAVITCIYKFVYREIIFNSYEFWDVNSFIKASYAFFG